MEAIVALVEVLGSMVENVGVFLESIDKDSNNKDEQEMWDDGAQIE